MTRRGHDLQVQPVMTSHGWLGVVVGEKERKRESDCDFMAMHNTVMRLMNIYFAQSIDNHSYLWIMIHMGHDVPY